MVTVLLADGTILMHEARPYDPKKAHEYYLRVRKLKGRKKGPIDPKVATLAKRLAGMSDKEIHNEVAKSKDPVEKKLIATMLGNRQRIQSKKVDPKVLAVQKQHAAERVASLRSELADLNKKLKEALDKQRKTKAKAARGPTAADKSKSSRDAKKYRDKNKQTLSNKRRGASGKKSTSTRTRDNSVDSLKKRVNETQGKLDTAIKRQKSLG